jgi:hypothetical protein
LNRPLPRTCALVPKYNFSVDRTLAILASLPLHLLRGVTQRGMCANGMTQQGSCSWDAWFSQACYAAAWPHHLSPGSGWCNDSCTVTLGLCSQKVTALACGDT